ncbi:MAG: Rpn family recombination-promoting nuclease/putative transposase [Prevotellaceae bacterium]|jgi:predicted transposase/invertase (TIGR01784 family)|nr:Rpn family recombination-promoting nuclease/putative transposase [Prevotellaceae bacterium]
MARYLDPKYDLPFKKVFGEHKYLLISFLNALLPLPEGREIVAIEYLPPEQAPRTPLSKNSIVDVKCVDSQHRHFLVEMQMEWNRLFASRMLFNASKAYIQQFDKDKPEDFAKTFSTAQPVYMLAIVNANLPRQTPEEVERWYHHYTIADNKNPERVIEGMEFVTVELPKFKPETWNQTDKRMAVLWLRFLKEIDFYDAAPVELLETEEIRQAIDICEVGAYTKAELAIYDENKVQSIWDATYTALETTVAEQGKALAEKDAALARALAELAVLKGTK